MFSRINLKSFHFSLRTLLFSFMAFFILVLVAEGYYYYSTRNKIESTYITNTIIDVLRTSIITGEISGDQIILTGEVKKINGRTVELLAKTTKFDLPVEVVVHPDAVFFQSEFNQKLVDTQKQRELDGDYFDKIKAGSLVGFSRLYPLEEKNFQALSVYIEDL